MQWVQLSVGLDSSTLCSQVLFSRYSGFRLKSKTHAPDFATFHRFESQLSHSGQVTASCFLRALCLSGGTSYNSIEMNRQLRVLKRTGFESQLQCLSANFSFFLVFSHQSSSRRTVAVSSALWRRANFQNIMQTEVIWSYYYYFNIFTRDDHFSYKNCYQHGPCVHNTKDSHNTGNFARYSFRIAFAGSLTSHISFKHGRYCKTVPTVYSPYPRILESLTMFRCMAFHPRQNSMLHFTFYFSHFILHLLFDLRVYTFVIQLSSCNIQVLALYIHLFVGNAQVHVQVQRVVLPSFRIQCWAFANHVFAFNIWLYVFRLQVCIVHSTF